MNKIENKAHKPDQECSANFSPLQFVSLTTIDVSKQPCS